MVGPTIRSGIFAVHRGSDLSHNCLVSCVRPARTHAYASATRNTAHTAQTVCALSTLSVVRHKHHSTRLCQRPSNSKHSRTPSGFMFKWCLNLESRMHYLRLMQCTCSDAGERVFEVRYLSACCDARWNIPATAIMGS
jgi:hypothetical protein